MKKLMIFGLMLLLFSFGGNKSEIKNVHAAEVVPEPGTSATFRDSASTNKWLCKLLSSYAENIVSIKVSNKISDLPSSENQICEPIMIPDCKFAASPNGYERIPEEGVIFAYLSEAYDSTPENLRYDCVLYANAEKIYANIVSYGMFANFYAVEEIDLSMLDTSKVENMIAFFARCYKLKTIDLATFDISNASRFEKMFYKCRSLTELDLSNFNFSDEYYYYNMNYMFAGCNALKKLDISSFHITADSFTLDCFSNCTSLEYLKSPSSTLKKYPLPPKIAEYYGVTELTNENLSQYPVFNIPGDEFIKNWRALRKEGGDNGICTSLSSTSASNAKLTQLLIEYDSFDADYKEYVDKAIDKEDVSIGKSIEYVKNVLNGTQTTENDYGIKKDDVGSYMTISLNEESPYLIALISLIGILSVVGYYFYNKKKQAN